ncbi:hypothetical protein H8D04_01240 [bacterium]|nr:hypothetical protein [bacterium]
MKKVISMLVTLVTFFVISGCGNTMRSVRPGDPEYKHTIKGQADFKIIKFEVPYFNLWYNAPTEVPVYIQWNTPTPTHLRLKIEYDIVRTGPVPQYELWDRSQVFGNYYTIFDTEDMKITNPHSTHLEETFLLSYPGRYKMTIILWNKYHRKFSTKYFRVTE